MKNKEVEDERVVFNVWSMKSMNMRGADSRKTKPGPLLPHRYSNPPVHTHTPAQRHWIRGCLINVTIQSIAKSPVTGLPCIFLSISCHLSFLCFPYRFLCLLSSTFNLAVALKSSTRAWSMLVTTVTIPSSKTTHPEPQQQLHLKDRRPSTCLLSCSGRNMHSWDRCARLPGTSPHPLKPAYNKINKIKHGQH